MSNYVITVENGDINFNGSNHNLDNAILIAKNGNINLVNATVKNTAIFASGTINSNGGARFSGESLLANDSSNGNINFNGATATILDRDELRVISQGSITYNGASNTRGQFISKGNFTFNGSSILYGSINSQKDITFNGNATVIAVNQSPKDLLLNPNSIQENTANNSTVGKFTTIDSDTNDNFTYQLVAGTGSNDNNAFNLVNNELKINNSPDFEAKSSYSIRVKTSDRAGASIEKTFAISILDVNEAPTALNLSNDTVTENNPTGTIIGNFSSSDPDAGNTHSYSLVSGEGDADNSIFSIVGNTLSLDRPADFETKPSYSIRVRTTDAAGLSFERILAISVLNLNEAPAFDSLPVEIAALGKTYTYNIGTRDPENDRRTITAANLPDWLSFTDNGDGTASLTGTPQLDDLGNYQIELTVTDAGGLQAKQTLSLPVKVVLTEGINFNPDVNGIFAILDAASSLSFQFESVDFDFADGENINDALEVALLDGEGHSLVHTIFDARDSFFNLTEGESPRLGAGASYDAASQTVTLNLSGIEAGQIARLSFRLVNNDSDSDTTVVIRDFDIVTATAGTTPAIQTQFDSPPTTPNQSINFNSLVDVSESIRADYGITSFNSETKLLYSEVNLVNRGTYAVNGSLLLGITNISAPTVRLRDYDGITPEGMPYYDLSQTLVGRKLDPQQASGSRNLIFYNPDSVQFDYDLVVLSQLNREPIIESQPELTTVAGKNYSYDVEAVDPDQDSLSYKLLTAPVGMSIDAVTGVINWSATAADLGNREISIEVSDGRGGVALQQYTLAVVGDLPNRPPLFTSTPVVEAEVVTEETGKIIIANDEWTLSDLGFSQAPNDAKLFVNNIANYFTDGKKGSFLGYSNNFGIAGEALSQAFSSAGHQWTVTTQLSFTLETLQKYDGVFVGGFAADNQVLIDYVKGGGNVYILAGTGSFGVATSEARTWQPFLNTFGFSFANEWNNIAGNIPIAPSPHLIFAGVKQLFQNNGQTITDLNLQQERGLLIAKTNDGRGLYAVYDPRLESSEAYRYDAEAKDIDGDRLTYSLLQAPTGMWVEADTGVLHWLPTLEQLGIQSATIKVEDGKGSAAIQKFEILLRQEEGNHPPVIVSEPVTLASGTYFSDTDALDPDGDKIAYSLVNAPAGANIDPDSGQITWDVAAGNLGIHPVTVKAADGRGGIDLQTYNVEVTNNPPGTISGTKFYDLDGDGFWDGKTDNQPTPTSNPANLIAPVKLSQISTPFNKAIGIDYHEPTDSLVLSVNYNNGLPRNFERVAADGTHIPFSNLSGLSNEVKIATVRSGNLGGFTTGDLFVGNGIDGQIVRITNGGNTVINPWVDLPGSNNGLMRGSLHLDRTGVFGGDLIVATTTGQVWRVNASGQPTLIANAGVHLEGLFTVPDNPTRYGVLAGKIIAGAENQRLLYVFDKTGEVTTYNVGVAIEDIDFIEPNQNFFGVNHGTGKLLGAPASEFKEMAGDILLTQEIPSGSGLYRLYWDGASLKTHQLTLEAGSAPIDFWEHVTFAPASVVEISKVPTEPRLPDWTIYLDQNRNYRRDEGEIFTKTDSQGNYSFVGLTPGTYYVAEENQSGWLQTTPINRIHPVNLAPGANIGGINFGNRQGESSSNNLAPQINTIAPTSGKADTLYRYDVRANDPNGDTLSYDLPLKPEGMSIDPATGTIVWQPQAAQAGFHDIIVRANDGKGGIDLQYFQILIEPSDIPAIPSNTPPAIKSNPITTASLNRTYSYQIIATDLESQNLTYSLAAAPVGMSISQTGKITWTPQNNQIGTQPVEVRVSDSQGAVTTQTYQIQVAPTLTNNPPTITSTPLFLADTNSTYRYQIVASDPDNQTLTYQLLQAPAGVTLDPNTGLLEWQNPSLGDYQIVVAAIDPQGAAVTQGYSLSAKANRLPAIQSVNPPTTATPNLPYSYDIIATDPDGGTLTYRLDPNSQAAGMTLDQRGRLRWTPNNTQNGSREITITIADATGASIEQKYTLNVTADTTAPKLSLQGSSNIASLDETVYFQILASDSSGIANLQLLINNQPVSIDPNGIASYKTTAFGTITARAVATDKAGNTTQTSTSIEILDLSDTDAPRIDLKVPTGVITNPTDLIGSITDDNLQYYSLEIAPADGSSNWQEIYRSSTQVNNGTIAKIDPTLLANDSYNLRLTAVDNGGNSSSSQNTISVAGELKLGNFQLSFTDITLPVSGIPISVTRTYDTLTSNTKDDFGYGWRLEWRDTNLKTSLGTDDQLNTFGIPSRGFRTGDKVYITLPGGKRETYTFSPELDRLGGFLLDQNGNGGLWHPKFISSAGSTNTLSTLDLLLTKNQNGDFVGIGNGNYYNPAQAYFGSSYTLTAKTGIVYQIDAVSGDLDRVTDTNGNQLTFTEAGISSNSGVGVKFGRDAAGRIVKVIDPMGNEIGYEYSELGDLIKVIDREGNTTQFDYNNTRAHYLDKIIDPLGREAVKTEYDETGRLKRTINAGGNGIEFIYNPENSLQTIKDALGNETTYEYDTRGNVVTEIDAVGKITKRTYDSNNYQLSETIITKESGTAGWTTTYTYDSQGNKLTETNFLGNVTRYIYDSRGHILSEIDAVGNITTNTYDSRSNLLTSKDAAGNITNYNYDFQGNLVSLIDPVGNTSRFSYDSKGNVTKVINALGNETTYTYDSNSNQLTEAKKITTKNGIEIIVTRNQYDKTGNLLAVTDPLGNITRYEYDKLNRQTAVIDAKGRRTEYRYDEVGNLIETIYPDTTPNNLSDNPRTKTEYDVAGREIASTDAGGRTTKSVYDVVGNLVETIYPDTTPNDPSDNPRTMTEYYQDGRVKAQIDEKGNRIEQLYNANGQLVKITYPLVSGSSQATIQYGYDKLGRKISETDGLERTTKFVYDQLGRLVQTIFADGTFISNTYDKFGRNVATTDQNGKVTESRYDNTGNLTGVKDALGNWTTYAYTSEGKLLSSTDANGHSTSYEYDILGRKVATILPLSQTSLIAYDAVGNIISKTDFNGKTTTYKYDAQNRLVEQNFSNETSVKMTYTTSGQIATIADDRGVTSFTYDSQDRLFSRIDVDGSSISYSYDEAGNRTSVTTQVVNGNANITYYTFDQLNRLDKVLSGSTLLADYDYDSVNNLVKTQYGNGVIETRQYDKLNHLLNLQTSLGNDILTNFTYTLDKAGNRQQVVETMGNNSRTVNYTYDDLYQLTKEQVTDAINGNGTTEFTYDLVGNRQQQKVTSNNIVANTTYQYDANDRLLKEQVNGNDKVAYTYDNNGNTLTKIEDGKTTESIWNDQNRLIGAKLKDVDGVVIQNVVYEYDASGIRISQNVNGEITKYLIDANLPYAQALVEYRPSGLVVVFYNHGNDLISQTRDGESSFYHVDGLGSTRGLSDESGNLIDSYNYQAFGELLNATGGSDNNYLFAGEQLDPVLGDYYNRARYYDPQTGRFTRRDSYSGNIVEPSTLHKYLYTSNNPVNLIDPTGLYTLRDISAASSMLNQLSAQIYFSANSVVLEKAVLWATLLAASAAIGILAYVVEKTKQDGSPDIKVFPDEWFEKPKPKNEPKYFDDLDEMAQLRVQVQDAPGHTLGIPMYNHADVGVTLRQVFVAVGELWKRRESTTSWLSKDYDTMFIGGMAFLTKAAAKIQENQGTSGKGGEQLATYQWDKKVYSVKNAYTSYGSTNKKQYYRFDLENLRGKNLRRK